MENTEKTHEMDLLCSSCIPEYVYGELMLHFLNSESTKDVSGRNCEMLISTWFLWRYYLC